MDENHGAPASAGRKPVPESSLERLVVLLDKAELCPPEAIEQLAHWRPAPLAALEQAALGDRRAYVRLCAAWALGALGAVPNADRLIDAYLVERDGNVRANLIWAIARVCPQAVTPPV